MEAGASEVHGHPQLHSEFQAWTGPGETCLLSGTELTMRPSFILCFGTGCAKVPVFRTEPLTEEVRGRSIPANDACSLEEEEGGRGSAQR